MKTCRWRRAVLCLVVLLPALAGCEEAIRYQNAQRPQSQVARGTYAYAGLPKATLGQEVTVLTNDGYVIGYSESRKDPLWAVYRVFKPDGTTAEDRPSRFKTDDRTKARVRQEDYAGCGYDRGHMAPSYAVSVCYGREAQLQTFMMSNVCPQKPDLNRRVWLELEMKIAKDWAPRLQEVWVTVGPVFSRQPSKLACGVAVPEAFFSLVLDEQDGKPRALALLVSQDAASPGSLTTFLTTVHEVERRTGLDFYADLPDDLEERLESAKATALW